jgi:hypothetical protein
MVRLLGRISDKRIFFQDSYTILDHGSTVTTGAGASYYVNTHQKSVIWGWASIRRSPGASIAWVVATSGNTLQFTEAASVTAALTLDWWAIGYTS